MNWWAPEPALLLPRQGDKDHSNLWNPCAVELGLSPAFSVTVHTGCLAHRNGNRESSIPPASEMFVLSRSLAVNDFLRGGSSPGTQSRRSAWSCGTLCVLAATGCGEYRPLLWGACQSSLSAGKGVLPLPCEPHLAWKGSGTMGCWIQHQGGTGAPFWGVLSLGTGVGSGASRVAKCWWLCLAPASCCCSSAPLSSQAWDMSPLGPAGSRPGILPQHHSSATVPGGFVTVEVALKLVAGTSPVPEAVGREVMATAGPCHHPYQDTQGQELHVPDPGAPEVAEQPREQL